jgi:hypothetical protein
LSAGVERGEAFVQPPDRIVAWVRGLWHGSLKTSMTFGVPHRGPVRSARNL